MNIMELLSDSSKLTAIHAGNVAMQKPEIIPLILKLALENKHQYSMRAANTIEKLDFNRPELVKPFYTEIIEALPAIEIQGVQRCFLKLLVRHTNIKNEETLCSLLNFSFDKLSSPTAEVAVKVYAMEILYHISKVEPDLKNELVSVIKAQMTDGSSGFKSCGSRIIKACQRL